MPFVILSGGGVLHNKLIRTEGLPDDIAYPKIFASFGLKYEMLIIDALNILGEQKFQIVGQSNSSSGDLSYTLFIAHEIQIEQIKNPYCPYTRDKDGNLNKEAKKKVREDLGIYSDEDLYGYEESHSISSESE